ncbi:hypothetical protein ACJQWK_09743 [Exserohilum turcicum]
MHMHMTQITSPVRPSPCAHSTAIASTPLTAHHSSPDAAIEAFRTGPSQAAEVNPAPLIPTSTIAITQWSWSNLRGTLYLRHIRLSATPPLITYKFYVQAQSSPKAFSTPSIRTRKNTV